MKYFFAFILFWVAQLSFAEGKINLIPVDQNYQTQGFGEDFVVKKEPEPKKFLQNNATIELIIQSARLNNEVRNWDAFSKDELLLRAFHLPLSRLTKLYPKIQPSKLSALRKMTLVYEKK